MMVIHTAEGVARLRCAQEPDVVKWFHVSTRSKRLCWRLGRDLAIYPCDSDSPPRQEVEKERHRVTVAVTRPAARVWSSLLVATRELSAVLPQIKPSKAPLEGGLTSPLYLEACRESRRVTSTG